MSFRGVLRRSNLNAIWIAALHFIPLAMTCVSKSVNSYNTYIRFTDLPSYDIVSIIMIRADLFTLGIIAFALYYSSQFCFPYNPYNIQTPFRESPSCLIKKSNS